MPIRKYHLEFDEYLRWNGYISGDTYGDTIHNRMDKGSKKFFHDHREMDYFHSVDGIRTHIDNIINSLGQISVAKATDYVRIAWGHICLDYTVSRLKGKHECKDKDLNWPEVYKIALRTYKYYRLQFKYYKQRYR